MGVVQDNFEIPFAVACVTKGILHLHDITSVVWSEVVISHGKTGVSKNGRANVLPSNVCPWFDGKTMVFRECIVSANEIRQGSIEVQTELFYGSKGRLE